MEGSALEPAALYIIPGKRKLLGYTHCLRNVLLELARSGSAGCRVGRADPFLAVFKRPFAGFSQKEKPPSLLPFFFLVSKSSPGPVSY